MCSETRWTSWTDVDVGLKDMSREHKEQPSFSFTYDQDVYSFILTCFKPVLKRGNG